MARVDTLLRHYLRGRILVALLIYALPMLALMVMGSLWLADRGLILPFFGATALCVGLFTLINRLIQRQRPKAAMGEAKPLVHGNPDWTSDEAARFQQLSREIRDRIGLALPWERLQAEALWVIERGAELSGRRGGALSFTLPEALLLADRLLMRLRGDLRRNLPMAEMVPMSALIWIWSNRRALQRGLGVAQLGWRLQRMVVNPVAGVMQEAQGLLLSEAGTALRKTGEAGVQRLLLEEVAVAAIDLYGGHLRFTEAELLEIALSSTAADQGRMAPPDAPLRVLVVGQISAGKTTLINALAGESLGETDMAPTTPGLTTHGLTLEEGAFTFVDTAGIDGSKATEDRLLKELLQADLVVWAVRANRPARAPDVALLNRLRQACDGAGRRRPPVIVALTAVDLLLPGWPFAEHLLPPEVLARLSEILAATGADLGESAILPLAPDWNVEALEALILSRAAEALMVQRNRKRLAGKPTVAGEIAKTTHGIGALARLFWRRD